MAKLTIILGKRIGLLKNYEIEQMGLMVNDDGKHAQLTFPEQHSPFVGWVCPRHPADFVPEAMDDILWRMYHGVDMQVWTMSEYMVSAIAQAVGNGKIIPSAVEIRLYADDNKSFQRFGLNAEGVLIDVGDGGWPYGWFMPDLNP